MPMLLLCYLSAMLIDQPCQEKDLARQMLHRMQGLRCSEQSISRYFLPPGGLLDPTQPLVSSTVATAPFIHANKLLPT
jgi:hypothetical protein